MRAALLLPLLAAGLHGKPGKPLAKPARVAATAAGIALSSPNAPSLPVPLTGPADVVQLCRHLTGLIDGPPADDPVAYAKQREAAAAAQKEARDQEYEVRLPPAEFRFGAFDADGETLDVGGKLTAGHGLLDLLPNEVALELAASAAEASQAFGLWRAGKGALQIDFDLDDSVTCEGSPQSPPWLLPVRLLRLGFVDGQGQLVLDGANGLASHGDKRGAAPGVSVAPIVSLDGRSDAARVALSLLGTPGLQQCYTQALGRAPQLEGTVVFQARFDARGKATELQVALEDLGAPELVGCLGDSIRMATLAGTTAGAKLLLPLELRRL